MPNLTTRLSKNFTLGEFCRSATAERDPKLRELQRNPEQKVITKLRYLTRNALQPVREELSYPIRITSGYRHPLVNKLVGGSGTSQHCLGEAADCEISRDFLENASPAENRERIRKMVEERAGARVRDDVNENFYLFALIALNIEQYDIDQVIHEYGEDFGRPAWVHISASRRMNRRQILFVGDYTEGKYQSMSPIDALRAGTEEPVVAESREQYGVVTSTHLNIRNAPNGRAKRVAAPLANGRRVRILQEQKGWYEVALEEQGWVSAQYVRVERDS